MDENQNGELDTLNQEENDTQTNEEMEEIMARLSKAEELANNYRIRAEKAEKESKAKKEETITKNNNDLTSKEIFALMKANVEESDIDDIKDYAKLKGITISDALGTGFIKAMLADKAEQKRVADASNVSNTRRGSGKVSDEVLLDNVGKGIFPENDADINRLVALRNKK